MRTWRGLFLTLLLLYATPPVEAAPIESALAGRVLASDVPASGVTVTVTMPSRETSEPFRTTVSDAHGRWWIAPLPPGAYDVTFARSGFGTLMRSAVVELGQVTRIDARLEPTEDEETITQTTRDVNVTATTAIATYFSPLELDRLPVMGRVAAALLSPAPLATPAVRVDGASPAEVFVSDEGVQELVVVRAAAGAEIDDHYTSSVAVRTRSGADELALSVRGTWSDAFAHGWLLESASGGRLIPQRLWFFASGWSGDAAYAHRNEVHGAQLSLDAQPGAGHHLEARWLDSDGAGIGTSIASLRYDGTFGARFTLDSWLATARTEQSSLDTAAARLSWANGSHVLATGLASRDGDNSLFVSDRYTAAAWTLDAGIRADENRGETRLLPRIAATYDLRGNGRQAFAASFGQYADSTFDGSTLTKIAAVGFVSALGTTGHARLDYLRHDGHVSGNSLQAEARYRLFDRIESGATYGYHDLDSAFTLGGAHRGAVWGGVQLPVGDHEAGFTLLGRYDDGFSTDLALRYVVPFSRLDLTLAGDVVNLFDEDFVEGRTLRIWARLSR